MTEVTKYLPGFNGLSDKSPKLIIRSELPDVQANQSDYNLSNRDNKYM